MMTGELEYDGYYVEEPLFYPEASYGLFICFVIIVPIVFMNLLVGLAVDDIKEVQHRAGLERSVMKIELIFQVRDFVTWLSCDHVFVIWLSWDTVHNSNVL